MFTFEGKPLIPTKRAVLELHEINLDMYDVIKILEEGFNCSRSKRKKNIIERCVRKRKKIIKVVVAEIGNYFKLIHASKFSISKKFKGKENGF